MRRTEMIPPELARVDVAYENARGFGVSALLRLALLLLLLLLIVV
jgi:hypothetical protein